MQDQNQTVVVKANLKKKKHDEESKEGWVECEKCKKWVHQICGLYNVKLDKKKSASGSQRSNDAYEFYCPQCCLDRMEVKKLSKDRTLGPPTKGADKLDSSSMTDYIEKLITIRLKQLRKKEADRLGVRVDRVALPEVYIRTILNRQEPLDVQDQMIRRYKNHGENGYPREYSYKSKCILMFQRIDGVDVLIFGMYVQEFDEKCEGPNQRSVYISYLDSVNIFSQSNGGQTFSMS